jgi:hypothetical protein
MECFEFMVYPGAGKANYGVRFFIACKRTGCSCAMAQAGLGRMVSSNSFCASSKWFCFAGGAP